MEIALHENPLRLPITAMLSAERAYGLNTAEDNNNMKALVEF